MGDRNLTLLELHLNGDTTFGPSFGGSEESGESESSGGSGFGSDVDLPESGGSPVRGVLGLVAIVLAVFAMKKLLGGGEFESEIGE